MALTLHTLNGCLLLRLLSPLQRARLWHLGACCCCFLQLAGCWNASFYQSQVRVPPKKCRNQVSSRWSFGGVGETLRQTVKRYALDPSKLCEETRAMLRLLDLSPSQRSHAYRTKREVLVVPSKAEYLHQAWLVSTFWYYLKIIWFGQNLRTASIFQHRRLVRGSESICKINWGWFIQLIAKRTWNKVWLK